LRIISANGYRYRILGTVPANRVEELADSISDLKKLYTLADTVLRNGDNYYICNQLIEAEWKEVNT
tara:strand:- start:1700 stop:1897 length:198 start_codon:yes stop_codon:yes gene_type:complete